MSVDHLACTRYQAVSPTIFVCSAPYTLATMEFICYRLFSRWWPWTPKDRFVALKILTKDAMSSPSTTSELELSRRIATADPHHPGLQYVRLVLDSFDISSPQGNHVCLVYEPMRETLSTFQERTQNRRLPSNLMKPLLRFLLLGLDYLHTKCHVSHTGLRLSHHHIWH
jgi:serine/threonine protein kinase